jgi:hypothetical protein
MQISEETRHDLCSSFFRRRTETFYSYSYEKLYDSYLLFIFPSFKRKKNDSQI